MKNRITALILSMTLVPSFSMAEDAYSKFHFKGSEVYITYFFASKFDVKTSEGGTDISASYSGSPISKFLVPAIGYRWDYIRNDRFGLTMGARYEFERSYNSATGTASSGGANTTFTTSSGPTFSFVLLEPNITHTIDGAYWYFGTNYPIVASKSGIDNKFEAGDPGFQVGLGWDWGNHISNIEFAPHKANFEIYFQNINFRFSDASGDTWGRANMTGGGLRWGLNFR